MVHINVKTATSTGTTTIGVDTKSAAETPTPMTMKYGSIPASAHAARRWPRLARDNHQSGLRKSVARLTRK